MIGCMKITENNMHTLTQINLIKCSYTFSLACHTDIEKEADCTLPIPTLTFVFMK